MLIMTKKFWIYFVITLLSLILIANVNDLVATCLGAIVYIFDAAIDYLNDHAKLVFIVVFSYLINKHFRLIGQISNNTQKLDDILRQLKRIAECEKKGA